MKNSLKDNYIKLSKNFGGTHALISKGVKKGIVNSIMRGSIPKANELYEVAKIMGVTVEELLSGKPSTKEGTDKTYIAETALQKTFLANLKRVKEDDTVKRVIEITLRGLLAERNLDYIEITAEEAKRKKEKL